MSLDIAPTLSTMERALLMQSRTKFIGSVRIDLEQLKFSRQRSDAKYIESFIPVLKADCQRLRVRNHIPAIIDEQTLQESLVISDLSIERLLENRNFTFAKITLPLGYYLECLQGFRRIEAAKQVLRSDDRWWVVDLYTDVDETLLAFLKEDFSHEAKPSDGEFLLKALHFGNSCGKSHLDTILEKRWWSWMSETQRRGTKAILRRERFVAILRKLSTFEALWTDMRLTTWHILFSLHCDEEILHYLNRIYDIWSTVSGPGDSGSTIDRETVEKLGSKAPAGCRSDWTELEGLIKKGNIFNSFSLSGRMAIWNRIQKIEGLILTFKSFFDDLNYFRRLVPCITKLVGPVHDKSLRAELENYYEDNGSGFVTVQIGETRFSVHHGDKRSGMNLAWRQLFVFAMRHWIEVPHEPQIKQASAVPKASQFRLQQLAQLAYILGYRSPSISALKASPGEQGPLKTNTILRKNAPKVRRCGRPTQEEFDVDRDDLFINRLQGKEPEISEQVTSFYVRKSVYRAFFGGEPLPEVIHISDIATAAICQPPSVYTSDHMSLNQGSDQEDGARSVVMQLDARPVSEQIRPQEIIQRVTPQAIKSVHRKQGLRNRTGFASRIPLSTRIDKRQQRYQPLVDSDASGLGDRITAAVQDNDDLEGDLPRKIDLPGGKRQRLDWAQGPDTQQQVMQQNENIHTLSAVQVDADAHLDNEDDFEARAEAQQQQTEQLFDTEEVFDAEERSLEFRMLRETHFDRDKVVPIARAEAEAVRYNRDGYILFTEKGRVLAPQACSEEAIKDSSGVDEFYGTVFIMEGPDYRLDEHLMRLLKEDREL